MLPAIKDDHIVSAATPHVLIHESDARDRRTTDPDVRPFRRGFLSTGILGRNDNTVLSQKLY